MCGVNKTVQKQYQITFLSSISCSIRGIFTSCRVTLALASFNCCKAMTLEIKKKLIHWSTLNVGFGHGHGHGQSVSADCRAKASKRFLHIWRSPAALPHTGPAHLFRSSCHISGRWPRDLLPFLVVYSTTLLAYLSLSIRKRCPNHLHLDLFMCWITS